MTYEKFKEIDWETVLKIIEQRKNISEGLNDFMLKELINNLKEFIRETNLENKKSFGSYYDEKTKSYKYF